jgi:transcription antitermination factor NusG
MNMTSTGFGLREDSEALPSCLLVDSHGALQRNIGQPKWYAARTLPRHEKRVLGHLNSRSLECFLPLYQAVHRWKNGCKMRVELPLFPGYLFVRTDLLDRAQILSVPGILSLVGGRRCLWPLPEGEVEALRAGLHLRNPQPHPYLAIGQKVRIKTGPLAGLSGVLLRQKDGLRVVLSIEALMRGVVVDVDVDDIEALPPCE